MWHVIHDIWHMTCDTWYVTGGESEPSFKTSAPELLQFGNEGMLKKFSQWMSDWFNELLSNGGVCRTAPASGFLMLGKSGKKFWPDSSNKASIEGLWSEFLIREHTNWIQQGYCTLALVRNSDQSVQNRPLEKDFGQNVWSDSLKIGYKRAIACWLWSEILTKFLTEAKLKTMKHCNPSNNQQNHLLILTWSLVLSSFLIFLITL